MIHRMRIAILAALALAFAGASPFKGEHPMNGSGTSGSAPSAGQMGCGRPTVPYGVCVGGLVYASAGGSASQQQTFQPAEWVETNRQTTGKRTAHADAKYGTVTSSYSYSVSPDSVTISSEVSGQGKGLALSGVSYGSAKPWFLTPRSIVRSMVRAYWTDTLTLSSKTMKRPAGGSKAPTPADYIYLQFRLREHLGVNHTPDCRRSGTSYTGPYSFAYTSTVVASVLTVRPDGTPNVLLGGIGAQGGQASLNECPRAVDSTDALGLIGKPIKILLLASALDFGALYDGDDGTKSGAARANSKALSLCVRAVANPPHEFGSVRFQPPPADLEITSASNHNYRC